MQISTAFPSKYVSAADLAGQDVPVTIAGVAMEQIDNESLPVIHFTGMSKGMVLNKTNAFAIRDMYGDETDNWINRRITLYPDQTAFQGKIVACVRVRPQAGSEAALKYAVSQPVASGPGAVPSQQATPPAQTEDQGVKF